MMRPKIQVHHNSMAIIGWHEGGAGLVHSWLEKSTGCHVACFVNPDDNPIQVDLEAESKSRDSQLFSYPTENTFKGIPLINSSNWASVLVELGIKNVLVITSNVDRLVHLGMAREKKLAIISAIHPSALIMDDAVLDEGVVIHARACVGYKAEIHAGAIINTGAQIDHHCIVRSCASIDPGVIMAGNVTIGRFASVHTGAVIKNKIRIGENSVVGAGAVVIRDVPDNVTVVGVPARILEKKVTS